MSKRQRSYILEPEAIQLLDVHGVSYPEHGVAHSAKEAIQIADQLGYPVVLKVVSPDVLHKSDAGGVALGLEDSTSVHEAYGKVLTAVSGHVPGAEVQGMLVCQQAPPGLEVIVGAVKDPLFGTTLMFGLGGIFAEVLKDVSFRVAPLERRDAHEMIREIRGYPLLTGACGRESCDLGALADLLIKVSRMVMARPDIRELDLNPVRTYEKGLLVLDVRILTGS